MEKDRFLAFPRKWGGRRNSFLYLKNGRKRKGGGKTVLIRQGRKEPNLG